MEKWGPEYRVAMCEHHVMERMRRIADLEAEVARLQDELRKIAAGRMDNTGEGDVAMPRSVMMSIAEAALAAIAAELTTG
jgi:hypothetical protein